MRAANVKTSKSNLIVLVIMITKGDFYGYLEDENQERELINGAIADYVKNLSYAFRALESMTRRKTHNNETK